MCRSELDPSLYRVVVGSSYRLLGGDTYELSRLYVHESYSSVTLVNDIAMLVTSTIINFGQNVQSVLFPPSTLSVPVGQTALVSGFGKTAVSNIARVPSIYTNIIKR